MAESANQTLVNAETSRIACILKPAWVRPEDSADAVKLVGLKTWSAAGGVLHHLPNAGPRSVPAARNSKAPNSLNDLILDRGCNIQHDTIDKKSRHVQCKNHTSRGICHRPTDTATATC